MSPWTTFRMARSSLGANKMRAGLTLLGIVIGVSAVISLMAIGRGVQQSITSRIESLGTNLLFVRPGESSQGGVSSGLGSAATLTLDDAYAISGDRTAACQQIFELTFNCGPSHPASVAGGPLHCPLEGVPAPNAGVIALFTSLGYFRLH